MADLCDLCGKPAADYEVNILKPERRRLKFCGKCGSVYIDDMLEEAEEYQEKLEEEEETAEELRESRGFGV